MPFTETKEGQTQSCTACEMEAHHAKTNLKHVCGKEDNNKTMKTKEEIFKEFDEKFPSYIFDEVVDWMGEGHYCTHHSDDPAHGENCYKHPLREAIKPHLISLPLEVLTELEKDVDKIEGMNIENRDGTTTKLVNITSFITLIKSYKERLR